MNVGLLILLQSFYSFEIYDDSFGDILAVLQYRLLHPPEAEWHPALWVGVDEQVIVMYRVTYIIDSMYYIVSFMEG